MNRYPHSTMTGDVFACRNGTRPSTITLFFQRISGEPQSLAAHIGMMESSDELCHARQSTGVAIQTLTEYMDECYMTMPGFEWAVYRCLTLTEADRAAIAASLRSYKGTRYAPLELALCGIDWVIAMITGIERPVARRLGDLVPWNMICSKLVGIHINLFGMLPGRHEHDTPDDLVDAIIDSQAWACVDSSDDWDRQAGPLLVTYSMACA